MRDPARRERARLKAETYAPAPTDSRLLYGIIAASLLLVAALGAGAFYAVDVSRHPIALLVLVVLAFGAGLVVRRVQSRRHRKAHRVEYDRTGGDTLARPRRSIGAAAGTETAS